MVYGLNPLLLCFLHCQAGSLSLVSLGKPPQNFRTTTKQLQILKHTLQLHIWKLYVCHLQAISVLQWESCSLISYNELKCYCDILISRVNLESVLRKFCILTVNLGTFFCSNGSNNVYPTRLFELCIYIYIYVCVYIYV